MTEKEEEENEFEVPSDEENFKEPPIYVKEQLDEMLLRGHTDTSLDLEYFVDKKGKTRVRKKRLPVPNIFTTDFSTSHITKEDKEFILDHMDLIFELIDDSKRLAKFGKKKKVLINAFKGSKGTQILLYKGKDNETGKPILEERVLGEVVSILEEKEIPEDFFNLNSTINYFLNKIVSVAHVSKGLDGNAPKLSHHHAVSQISSEYTYNPDPDKERKEATFEPEKSKTDYWNQLRDYSTGYAKRNKM